MQSETKNCQNCKSQFTIEPDDFSFYEKIDVPAPTWCPGCRNQRRLTWRNTLSLYNRICGLCGNRLVTLYSEESGIIPYCNKCYWSDRWDPRSYGREYDLSRPFFQQLKELELAVPHQATINDNEIASINCEYTHDCWYAKNCYMTFYVWHVENILYSCSIVGNAKNITDCLNILEQSEWLYDCYACHRCYQVKYSDLSVACQDSSFLYDCRGCSDCFMCAGLRNKRYHYQNREYTKEEYEKIRNDYALSTYEGIERARNEYAAFIKKIPRRYAQVYQSANCTGDLLYNGKNSKWCFALQSPIDSKWVDTPGDRVTNCYDTSTSGELSQCCEVVTCDQSNMNRFGLFSVKSQDLRYAQYCTGSKYLFGCVGLRKAEYCILNRQYSKEEYEDLVKRIMQQMNDMPYIDKGGVPHVYGDYFPSELSPFGYNETVANERFPLSPEEVMARGWRWQYNTQRTSGKETLLPEQIPGDIKGVSDTITDQVLRCVSCQRNYKIAKDELVFYRYMSIPIPRKCFFCRHVGRIQRSNPYFLWSRQCDCKIANHAHAERCLNKFETSYAPDRPEIIYCESCYQAEVS